jgi:hypothetical protein
MRVEDRLVGARNWFPWKERMVFVLEYLELWDIVKVVVPPIPVTAPILVAEFRRRYNKEKSIICDAMRDHIIPHLTGNNFSFDMWASLCKLYKRSNENHKIVLRD